MAYRLDTPKGKVQFEYDQRGAEAAARLAASLGVGNKTKRWFAQWEGKALARNGGKKTVKGERVREKGFPATRRGTVQQRGDQVSVVQWDNGDVRNVSNEYLIKLN